MPSGGLGIYDPGVGLRGPSGISKERKWHTDRVLTVHSSINLNYDCNRLEATILHLQSARHPKN